MNILFLILKQDWLAASRPPYTQAVANIRLIGTITAHMLAFLSEAASLDTMRVHMVGHSLGALLSGYVGETLRRRWSFKLGRITGLDPAEPHFEWGHPVTRLDETDAHFVDVIHTDGNPILSLGMGVIQPCGHLDFYPNGGKAMTGCERTLVSSLGQEDGNLAFAFRRLISCNHIRSYEYFIESINSDCPFLAVECSSWEAFVKGKCKGYHYITFLPINKNTMDHKMFAFKRRCLSAGNPSGCEYMGFRAFASLNSTDPPEFKHRHLYLMTEGRKPFCSFLYRVTVVLSDTKESLRQRGDR